MWADALQTLERAQLERLITWGAFSVLSGIVLVLFLSARRIRAPLPVGFGLILLGCGALELAWGAFLYGRVPLRDYGSALWLARTLWFFIEAEAAGIAMGATLAVSGWTIGRRLFSVGAGLGIVTHSVVLLALDLSLVRAIRL